MAARPSGKGRYKESESFRNFKIGSYSGIPFDMGARSRVIPHSCSTFVCLIVLFNSETRQAIYV